MCVCVCVCVCVCAILRVYACKFRFACTRLCVLLDTAVVGDAHAVNTNGSSDDEIALNEQNDHQTLSSTSHPTDLSLDEEVEDEDDAESSDRSLVSESEENDDDNHDNDDELDQDQEQEDDLEETADS